MTNPSDETKRLLMEYIGEKLIHFPGCGLYKKFTPDNCPQCKDWFNGHTFTTIPDLHAVFSAMVAKGEWEWEAFCNYAMDAYGEYWKEPESITDTFHFTAWLSCLNHPEQIGERMEMAANFIAKSSS